MTRAVCPVDDAGDIDLVDRRGEVEAAIVDQVDRRRGGDADRRGRHVLVEFAVDLGDHAIEWGDQTGLLQPCIGQGDARLADRRSRLGGLAGRGRDIGRRYRLVDLFLGDQFA